MSLLCSVSAWAEPTPGTVLGKENWQDAKGLLPEAMLRRFQDGSYRAKIVTLPTKLEWGSKFNAATEANAGKFAIDTEESLIDKATQAYPSFLYGYPFPQIDQKDPQAAAKVIYNFSYTLMQADDSDHLSTLNWVKPTAFERRAEFQAQLLFYGSRFSGPMENTDAVLRKGIIAGFSPTDIYGVLILEWVHLDPKQWNSLWTYIPELRRVRTLPAFSGSESLFGSDLAHDDPYLFSGKVQYFTWKLIGSAEVLAPYTLPNPKPLQKGTTGYTLEYPKDLLVMGWEKQGWTGKAWWPSNYHLVKRPVWVIEATAKDPQYAYDRQVLWIDQELYVAYYKETYNRAGQLWRMLLNSVSIGRTAEGDFSVAQPDFTLSVDELQQSATIEQPVSHDKPLAFSVGLSENLFRKDGLQRRGK
ncbi:MAG: DUF1329 domain-containing protein [Candidatus Binatia bacterium]